MGFSVLFEEVELRFDSIDQEDEVFTGLVVLADKGRSRFTLQKLTTVTRKPMATVIQPTSTMTVEVDGKMNLSTHIQFANWYGVLRGPRDGCANQFGPTLQHAVSNLAYNFPSASVLLILGLRR